MTQNHETEQSRHFTEFDYQARVRWLTEDDFVEAHEEEILKPLAEAIRKVAVRGTPLKILESGCGDGVNIMHLQKMGFKGDEFEFIGIEPCEEPLRNAVNRGLDVRMGNGLQLSFPDDTFDLVYCRDVLHHLADDDERKKFINEMRRVVKEKGYVVIVEPSPTHPIMFGFSVLSSVEKGIRRISESNIRRLIGGDVEVVRTSPSALWRMLYHHLSPFYRIQLFHGVTLGFLRGWEWLWRRTLPTFFWSCRAYIIQK
jgi:ubiquinone/menaquinone biosynthesis C-methylase UbiE